MNIISTILHALSKSTIFQVLIVSMLSVSYPILSQVVARLDDKYSSLIIVDLFNKEKSRKRFLFLLKLSVGFLLLRALELPRMSIIDIPKINFIIENSATILLVFSTVLLVIYFFKFVEIVLIYYTLNKFIPYLIEKHKNEAKDESITYFKTFIPKFRLKCLIYFKSFMSKLWHYKGLKAKDENLTYFRAICDIFYFSIKQQNETVSRTISDFLYSTFASKRDESIEDIIQYPSAYYEVTYKATEELAKLNNNKLKYLERVTVGGIWLLGELKTSKISETTFNWLWHNLTLALTYEKDNMIISYWERAHQHFTYNLESIQPDYSETNEIINTSSITARNQERERFLEFHYALGGLLLYKERFNCLGRIFKFTNSIPPDYVLLPESMNEVFEIYFKFRDPYHTRYNWIANTYPFPELEGLRADGLVQKWICQYIAVLFLRQYTIIPHLIYMTPLALPTIPETQSEKKLWIDNLDFFHSLVKEVYNNEVLKQKIGLSFLNDEWCTNNNSPRPLEMINNIKTNVIDSFENAEIEQNISELKVNQFYESSKILLINTLKKNEPIINKEKINEDFNNWFINGERIIIDKSAFADDQGVSHLNFDSILASSVLKKHQTGISETFFFNKTNNYLLHTEDIFPAIDKLNVNTDEHIIVCFGINLNYFANNLKIPNLNENKYNNIDIFSLSGFNHSLVGESLFVLKKSDLPYILYKDLNHVEIEKYSLNKIDGEFNLFASVIDLNANQQLQEESSEFSRGQDLRKSVLLAIGMKAEVRWKKKINSVFFRVYSQFRERGLPNSLSDIKEIE